MSQTIASASALVDFSEENVRGWTSDARVLSSLVFTSRVERQYASLEEALIELKKFVLEWSKKGMPDAAAEAFALTDLHDVAVEQRSTVVKLSWSDVIEETVQILRICRRHPVRDSGSLRDCISQAFLRALLDLQLDARQGTLVPSRSRLPVFYVGVNFEEAGLVNLPIKLLIP